MTGGWALGLPWLARQLASTVALMLLNACAGEAVTTSVAPDDASAPPQGDGPQLEDIRPPGPCDGLADGAPCDDGTVCTTGDVCVLGFCVGEALQCDVTASTPCTPSLCDPVLGCVNRELPDGAACNANCFVTAECLGGECVGLAGAEITCPPSNDPCVESIGCSPDSGQCSEPRYRLACPEAAICAQVGESLACLERDGALCRPCRGDDECADDAGQPWACRALPAPIVAESGTAADQGTYCQRACNRSAPCPTGLVCSAGFCSPPPGEACRCDATWSSLGFDTACATTNEHGRCEGRRRCAPGGLTSCDAPVPGPERCNGVDDDCDGVLDHPSACGASGACCLPNGTCESHYFQSCLALGGRYAGDGIACSGPGVVASCGAFPGACCASGCDQTAAADCPAAFGGDGTSCAVCAQPLPTGACCTPAGECSVGVASACLYGAGAGGHPGVWSAAGSSCETANGQPVGACCGPGGDCLALDEAACVGQGGGWDADAKCKGGSCPVPAGQGACCTTAGACAVLDEAFCKSLPGQYLPNEPCAGQCQSDVGGACCDLLGNCAGVAIDECDPSFSTWKGTDAMCPTACDTEKGACCVGLFCYPDLSSDQCQAVLGTWFGSGSQCTGSCVD